MISDKRQGAWRLWGLAWLGLFLSPAWAVDGRTAVGMCIDSTASGARCGWSVNDKGEIDICNKNGCVYCPSSTAECTVAQKGRPRPRRTLPEGVEASTPLGGFKVGSDNRIDELIKPKKGR